MKILIIRFSSIGDLTQALSIPSFIKHYEPNAEVHFVTRMDLKNIVETHPQVSKVFSVDRNLGLTGLFQLISELKKQNYTHIYDAHNNLRSLLIRLFLFKPKTIVRPMMRIKRFFLIHFHKNFFEMPFSGQRDLIKPLELWNYKFFLPDAPQIFLSQNAIDSAEKITTDFLLKEYTVLVPSAAYELKRWPIEHWEKLITLHSDIKFVILAGPADRFTEKLSKYQNVLNLTGQTDLLTSAALIKKSQAVISNDTGLLHFAEQLGKPTLALMGPAPFGFPSRKSTKILEKNLSCRPCSKHGQGPCTNKIHQACLSTISPEEVSSSFLSLLEKTKCI